MSACDSPADLVLRRPAAAACRRRLAGGGACLPCCAIRHGKTGGQSQGTGENHSFHANSFVFAYCFEICCTPCCAALRASSDAPSTCRALSKYLAACSVRPRRATASQIYQRPGLDERLRLQFQDLSGTASRRFRDLSVDRDARQPVIRRGVHRLLIGLLQRPRETASWPCPDRCASIQLLGIVEVLAAPVSGGGGCGAVGLPSPARVGASF